MNNPGISAQDKELLDKFVNEHKLFYAPDPEIMEDHRIGTRFGASSSPRSMKAIR